jgi:hypothetical protein
VTSCVVATGIHPISYGQTYTLNPNQWGLLDGEDPNLCMNVTTFENGTYPTKESAPAWSITWQYPPKPATAPVHGFPNIKLDTPGLFPVRVQDLSAVNIEADWMYSVGDVPAPALDAAYFSSSQTSINTNVAIDIFLDPSSSNAQDTTKAKYEIMVWLATFGASTQPIGLAQGARDSVTINGTVWNLYFGTNDVTQQVVLTWSANTPITNFQADIAPLLQRDVSALGGPSQTDYMGYMALGSEVLDSTVNVTLSVPTLSMDVVKKA